MDKEQDLSEITLLGNQNTKYKFEYDPTILEKFKKKFDDSIEDEQIVNLDCFEFQSRCLKGAFDTDHALRAEFYNMVSMNKHSI